MQPNVIPLTPHDQGHFFQQLYHKTPQGMSSLKTSSYSIVCTAKFKHGEMAFPTSRSASKHVIFSLGIDPTARGAGEGRGSNLVLQAIPFAVLCETSSRPCSLATQI